ncbi:glycosyltransferase family 2 protein [Nibricoccus aquaticus]|uniref:glycosyltransferase family 2 protein n=1 Tax=Nibricoccus aquaticus TaxID=2576891 RepID=UPI0015869E27|nr:glycosyltransferase [Nibricoccus aquaticus]
MNASPPESSTARVRVFLPTYRRHALLPRAVASLRAQSFQNWICELHNDDPADPFPGELVAGLADPRIHFVQHARNLGPIETFNRFYQPTAEPFVALLEDDNTWEPTFLETMLAAMDAHPSVTLAWCNQHIIQEDPDGHLTDTNTFANPPSPSSGPAAVSPRLQPWGQLRQITGALHANGAMLLRSRPGQSYPTPQIPFGCVEAFRERMFPHPLLYVPQPLATFTITQQTARTNSARDWSAALALLAASFLKHARLSSDESRQLCADFRSQRPPMTDTLISAALQCREARALLRHITPRDWFHYTLRFFRPPLTAFHTLRARSRHPDWWDLLDRETAARFQETSSSARPPQAVP